MQKDWSHSIEHIYKREIKIILKQDNVPDRLIKSHNKFLLSISKNLFRNNNHTQELIN